MAKKLEKIEFKVYTKRKDIKEGVILNKDITSLRRLVFTALFSALCTVATMIAFPAGYGYVNAGDMIVLLGAFTLSPVQAVAAAGIGSAMADIIGGYALYAPGTLIIKMLMAAVACYLCRALKRINLPSPVTVTFSAVSAELIMVLGYLAYEWFPLGYGSGALASIPSNLVQAAFGCVGGICFYYITKSAKLTDKLPAI